MKNNKQDLFSNLIMSLVIVFFISSGIFMAIGTYSTIHNEQRAAQLYDDTLEAYSEYIDNILNYISKSVVNVFNYEQGSVFASLSSDDTLTQRMAEIQLQKYLEDKSVSTDIEQMMFVYYPSKQIQINTTVAGAKYYYYQTRWDIISNLVKLSSTTDNRWQLISIEGDLYFLILFYQDHGYAGSIVNASEFIDQMASAEHMLTDISFQGTDTVLPKATDLSSFWFFTNKIQYLKPIGNSNIVLLVSMESFINQSSMLRYLIYMVMAILLCTLLFTANMRRQRHQLLDPMTDLQHAMLSFGQGNLDIRLGKSGNEKVNELYDTFNQMAEQITKLKIQVYEDELRNQTIMSNYLKLQIQPHFYANILNIIYGLAGLKDYQKIQTLSKTTASYFRYLLSEKGTFYPLKSEISCLHDFAGIQEIRYEDMISFQFDIDKTLYQEPVPPMILLTFFSNSVKHNITFVPKLAIIVSVVRRDSDMVLSVTDNGRGMDPEIAEQIRNKTYQDNSGKHVGISNLVQRLNMLYSEHWSIEVATGNNRKGTSIQLVIPLINVGNDKSGAEDLNVTEVTKL